MMPLDVDCPTCGSRKTWWCFDPKTKKPLEMPVRFHRARIELARLFSQDNEEREVA